MVWAGCRSREEILPVWQRPLSQPHNRPSKRNKESARRLQARQRCAERAGEWKRFYAPENRAVQAPFATNLKVIKMFSGQQWHGRHRVCRTETATGHSNLSPIFRRAIFGTG